MAKPSIGTRREFMDWLAEQPDGRRYAYADPRCCVTACYLKHRGFGDAQVFGVTFHDFERGKGYVLPQFFLRVRQMNDLHARATGIVTARKLKALLAPHTAQQARGGGK